MNLLANVGFCAGTAKIWQLVGNVLTIFKIVIPLIIIIRGMIDLGTAVIGSKPEEITKSAKSLGFRIIAGILIFFVPTLVAFAFSIVDDFSDVSADYDVCATCISSPKSCSVKNSN